MTDMDPAAQERFEKVDLKLLEHDEKLYAHDRSLLAIRKLLGTGMRLLADVETKMVALAESETLPYGTMQQLAEAQKQTAEAQKRTEEALRRFLERSGNGHSS